MYLTSTSPLMVEVMNSIPTGGNFQFLLKLFKTLNVNFVQKQQKGQILVENENLD